MASKSSKTRPKPASQTKDVRARRSNKAAPSRAVATAVDDVLFGRVAEILEQARSQVARTVNTAMVAAYWLVGREIVEVEQSGKHRADYGESLIVQLSERLRASFGKGFGRQNLRSMRSFYLAFPRGSALPEIRQAAPGELAAKRQALPGQSPAPAFSPAISWTHHLELLKVTNPEAGSFYEIEATRQAWSTRQLERQVAALLYERLANSRTPEKVLALGSDGQEVAKPTDVTKDPFVLEFLDLANIPAYTSAMSSKRSLTVSRRSCSSWARASASSDARFA